MATEFGLRYWFNDESNEALLLAGSQSLGTPCLQIKGEL